MPSSLPLSGVADSKNNSIILPPSAAPKKNIQATINIRDILKKKIAEERNVIAALDEEKQKALAPVNSTESPTQPGAGDSKLNSDTINNEINIRKQVIITYQKLLESLEINFQETILSQKELEKQISDLKNEQAKASKTNKENKELQIVNLQDKNTDLTVRNNNLTKVIERRKNLEVTRPSTASYAFAGFLLCLGLAFCASGLGAAIGVPLVALGIVGIGAGIATIFSSLVPIGISIMWLLRNYMVNSKADLEIAAIEKKLTANQKTPQPASTSFISSLLSCNKSRKSTDEVQPYIGSAGIGASTTSVSTQLFSPTNSPRPPSPSAPSRVSIDTKSFNRRSKGAS